MDTQTTTIHSEVRLLEEGRGDAGTAVEKDVHRASKSGRATTVNSEFAGLALWRISGPSRRWDDNTKLQAKQPGEPMTAAQTITDFGNRTTQYERARLMLKCLNLRDFCEYF